MAANLNLNILSEFATTDTSLNLILGKNNLMKAVKDEENLLIYVEDLFPDRNNKLTVTELWNNLAIYVLNKMEKFCYISSEFATIKQNESHNLDLFIQKFDQGFNSVYIVDENENFLVTVLRSKFCEDFPKKNFRRWNNLYIDYSDDEETLKWEIAKWCFGTSRKELPILHNGKVVASGRIEESTLLKNKTSLFPPIYWEIISDEIIKEFFENKQKILISSKYGNLSGFCERFDKVLDITIYDDSLIEKYLSGEFDMLIYNADVWSNASIPKYSAQHLYICLLFEQVKQYLENNNISYYYVGVNEDEIVNIAHKIDRKNEALKTPKTIFGGTYNDYTIYADYQGENKCNFINGARNTAFTPGYFERNIHFFGPCITVGTYTQDEQTIESLFQKIINQHNISGKVINHGQSGGFALKGRDINILYCIMDMNFHKGDIVIFIGVNERELILKGTEDRHFYFDEIFNKFELRNVKSFVDMRSLHLNAEGNRIVAEFLWEKLRDRLSEKVENSRQIVPSLFSVTPPPQLRLNMAPELRNYLTVLEEERVDYQNIGAMVMNCNPFTRGHRYLIEQAQKLVDFLYVFVVEEDSSDFSFKDRFDIVKANCSDLQNIKVLPSGKYMISSITFAEYFQKDDLQGQQTMIPAMDVRLFGQAIAPTLNIKKRFVGEEPLDTVTRQYNEVMKDMLPGYGVELVEIPRVTLDDGEPINATKVRKLILESDLKSCEKYLTMQTYLYIRKNFKRIRRELDKKR